MTDAKWFVINGDTALGPFSWSQLRAKARAGQINKESRLRQEGKTVDVAAGRFGDLFKRTATLKLFQRFGFGALVGLVLCAIGGFIFWDSRQQNLTVPPRKTFSSKPFIYAPHIDDPKDIQTSPDDIDFSDIIKQPDFVDYGNLPKGDRPWTVNKSPSCFRIIRRCQFDFLRSFCKKAYVVESVDYPGAGSGEICILLWRGEEPNVDVNRPTLGCCFWRLGAITVQLEDETHHNWNLLLQMPRGRGYQR